MATATLAIQVLPLQSEDVLAAVDAAIAAIKRAGVRHEVGPMETTLEGDDLNALVEVALGAHRAALESSGSVQSNIRILSRPSGLMSMEEKVAPHRSSPQP